MSPELVSVSLAPCSRQLFDVLKRGRGITVSSASCCRRGVDVRRLLHRKVALPQRRGPPPFCQQFRDRSQSRHSLVCRWYLLTCGSERSLGGAEPGHPPSPTGLNSNNRPQGHRWPPSCGWASVSKHGDKTRSERRRSGSTAATCSHHAVRTPLTEQSHLDDINRVRAPEVKEQNCNQGGPQETNRARC